jgi:hypothetical protein
VMELYGLTRLSHVKSTRPSSRSGDAHPQPVPEGGGPSENRRGMRPDLGPSLAVFSNLIATGHNTDLFKKRSTCEFLLNIRGVSPRYVGLEG